MYLFSQVSWFVWSFHIISSVHKPRACTNASTIISWRHVETNQISINLTDNMLFCSVFFRSTTRGPIYIWLKILEKQDPPMLLFSIQSSDIVPQLFQCRSEAYVKYLLTDKSLGESRTCPASITAFKLTKVWPNKTWQRSNFWLIITRRYRLPYHRLIQWSKLGVWVGKICKLNLLLFRPQLM